MKGTIEALKELGLSLHEATVYGLVSHEEACAIDELLAESAGPIASPDTERVLTEAEKWTGVPAEMTALARALFGFVGERAWGGYKTTQATFLATIRPWHNL
jgi:hypothetical protein